MTIKFTDTHHHVFPAGLTPHRWDIETDIKEMNEAGIEQVILSCPVPVGWDKVREINELMAVQRDRCPERYRALGSLNYDATDKAIAEIDYALNVLNLDGFILSSNNNSIYISDDSLDPIFDYLNERKAVVFLHPSPKRAKGYDVHLNGADDSAYEYTFETTRAMMDYIYRDKYLRNPDITWILSHGGGTIPYLAHRVSHASKWHAARQDEECIMKQLKSLYYDLALCADPLNYQFLKDFCGTEHILFGSDYPAHKPNDIRADVQTFINTDVFSEAEKELIASGNIKRILEAEYE